MVLKARYVRLGAVKGSGSPRPSDSTDRYAALHFDLEPYLLHMYIYIYIYICGG